MFSRSVFLVGPGFIGQEIIGHLLRENYTVTALVRTDSAATALQAIGVKTISGTLDDKDIITQQVLQSNIVFHTAGADDVPSASAVVAGIQQRAAQGLETTYVHTSGASMFADQSAGDYLGEKTFSDETSAAFDALPDSAHHRNVDLIILRGVKDIQDKVKVAIMIPPAIYGVGSNSKRLSIQYPVMTRYALKHGYAGHVGKGLSTWSQVHVKDLGRGYMVILHWLEGVSPQEAAVNPYWLCENGQELSWGGASAAIGQALFEAGRLPSADTKTIPPANYDDLFGSYATDLIAGSNARVRAKRLRRLGWTPQEKGTLESLVEDEIPLLLQEKGVATGFAMGGASADSK
ncbi:NAD dependent epimerase/dehydratase family protein [Sarocladium strictum]